MMGKTWRVEHTTEFGVWWSSLSERDQDKVGVAIRLLAGRGVALGHPHSSGVRGSRHGHLRELRVQSGGRPLRVLYAFDPRRSAVLLIGGDKTGDDRFYEQMIARADRLYDDHLIELEREGLL